ADYARALEFKPDHWPALYNRGRVYAELGQWPQAVADFNQGIAADPSQVFPQHALALVHLKSGDLAAYRETCARMVERFGGLGNPALNKILVETCVAGPAALNDFGP